MAKKSASGTGNIRKKVVTRNGKDYIYWEARYTAGIDPGTGKQIQRSITGKKQSEVAKKLKAVLSEIDTGTYIAPSNLTVSKWLDIWSKEYLTGLKPLTIKGYITQINTNIKPYIGAVKLEALNPHTVQSFYNELGADKSNKTALSPKSIKNVHGVLHKALKQAVANGYIRTNPTEACVLPKIQKADIRPFERSQISEFISLLDNEEYSNLFKVAMFTGMRQSELLGLTWDDVHFNKGIIVISKQLQEKDGEYFFSLPKNGKERTIAPAAMVLDALKAESLKQKQNKLKYGDMFNNEHNLVFTDALGKNLVHRTVVKHYKKLVTQIGIPEARFHDMRHTYAVSALQAGDDIKTVQENLGHATAAFTLEVYSHVTNQMKKDSSVRMEQYFSKVISG